MRRKLALPGFSFALAALAVATMAAPSFALTPPALQLTDSNGNTITLDSSGNPPAISGACTAATCVTSAYAVAAGSVTWSGTIGNFTLSTVLGRTKPFLANPNTDLGIASVTPNVNAPGTLTVSFTDVGFTGYAPATINETATIIGDGVATYKGYVDNTNVAFGTGTLVGTVGPTAGNQVLVGNGPTATTFSMTSVETISGTDFNTAFFTNDFALQAAPNALLTLTCPTSTGQVSQSYSSSLVANGGYVPYTYAISTGSLPTGLTLNTTSGAITGKPTASGTFSITGQVTDSSGSTATGVVTTSCSIVIAPAPPPTMTLSCPSTTTVLAGSSYAGSLSATGGLPPYMFSIVSGALPTGISLNASTGSISSTGVVTAAPGTYSYTAKVTDSYTPIDSAVSPACSLTVTAAPTYGISGEVFSDVDGSGSLNTGDTGIVGDLLTLKSGTTVLSTTTTNSTGMYSFGSLPAGTYTVCATMPANTTETYPVGNTTGCVSVTVGPTATNVNFGYVPAGNANTPLTVSCAASTATVGVAYNSSVAVTGGSGSYTYSLSSGTLPAGLVLNASTGAITGTPTSVTTANFTVKVVDTKTGAAGFSSCTGSCSTGTSAASGSFTTKTGNLGVTYSYTIGGISIPAYGYTTSGATALLYGETNGSGVGISGTSSNAIDTTHFVQLDISAAQAAGATSFQLLLTGISQCQNGESYSVYGSNTPGQIGTAIISSGNKNSSWFAVAVGTYKYISVKANSGGIILSAISFNLPTSCTIKVAGPLNVNCPSSSATVGKYYSSNAAVTGGTGPYTFSLVFGSLPAGLTLNSSTGAITGTPTGNGQSAFTIKVVDSKGVSDTTGSSGTCSNNAVVNHYLDQNDGDLGSSKSYTSNGYAITAYGFSNSGASAHLFGNNNTNNWLSWWFGNSNNNAIGIGVSGASGNEIDTTHFVQVDISNMVKAGALAIHLAVNDIQQGESYDIYGSNTLGSVGTPILTSQTQCHTYVAIPNCSGYKYLTVRAHSGTCMLGAVSTYYPSTCAINVNSNSWSNDGNNSDDYGKCNGNNDGHH